MSIASQEWSRPRNRTSGCVLQRTSFCVLRALPDVQPVADRHLVHALRGLPRQQWPVAPPERAVATALARPAQRDRRQQLIRPRVHSVCRCACRLNGCGPSPSPSMTSRANALSHVQLLHGPRAGLPVEPLRVHARELPAHTPLVPLYACSRSTRGRLWGALAAGVRGRVRRAQRELPPRARARALRIRVHVRGPRRPSRHCLRAVSGALTRSCIRY